MRIFVAVFPPREVVQSLAACLSRLKSRDDGISWVKPQNLHYTLRFLGELEEKRVAAVCRAVEQAVVGATSFEMTLGGAGAFPNLRRPRVLWIGAKEGAEELETLARSLQEALSREGFERPDKPFRAHLTVGRVRAPHRAARVAEQFARERPEGVFSVGEIVVVHSTLDPRGAVYRPCARVSLGEPRDR